MTTTHASLQGLSLHPPRPRQQAGSPLGILNPYWIGDMAEDISAPLPLLYIATGLTSNDWALADIGASSAAKPSTLPTMVSDDGAASDAGAPRFSITYPGLTTFNGRQFLSGSEDDDITPGRLTTFGQWLATDDTTPGLVFTSAAYIRVPFGVTGWEPEALSLYTRMVSIDSGVVGTLTVELMDPATSGLPFGSPVVHARTLVPGEDYTPSPFSAADMAGYGPDDVIKMAITVTVAPSGSVAFRFGRLDGPNWLGG